MALRLRITLFLLALTSQSSRADSIFTIAPGSTDRNAAHIGMSAMITTFAYALNRKGMRMQPVDAFIFSAVTTLAIGLTYKMLEREQLSYGELNHAMLYNNVGIAISGITINMGGW